MAVTIDDLSEFLGFMKVPSNPEFMQRCLDSAFAMLNPHMVTPDYQNHPVYESAILTIAADLWRIKDSPRGSYVFGDGTEMPLINAPRNTLPAVWPWLANAGLVKAAVVA